MSPIPRLRFFLYTLYNAIVQPYIDYCSPLWDNCGIRLKDGLQKYQNRAARELLGQHTMLDAVTYLET
jgi:hypothetical protein